MIKTHCLRIFALLCSILILCSGCASDNSNSNSSTEALLPEQLKNTSRQEIVFNIFSTCTDEGLLYRSPNCILRYFDLKTHFDTAICTDVSCLHDDAETRDEKENCNGYINNITISWLTFYYDNSLYFVAEANNNDDFSPETEMILFKANPDGTNRKEFAIIPYTQSINRGFLNGDYLCVGHDLSFDENNDNLEKGISHFSFINLKTGEVTTTPPQEHYSCCAYDICFSENTAVYSYIYLTEYIDFLDFDSYTDESILKISRSDLYKYDITTNEEKLLWSGNGECQVINTDYAVIYDYSRDKEIFLFNVNDLSLTSLGVSKGLFISGFDGENIIFCDSKNQKFSIYEISEMALTFDIPWGGAFSLMNIYAATSSHIYVWYVEEGDEAQKIRYGCFLKDDFYAARLDNMIKLDMYTE